jgi:tetratricopeptide (TPR) repeat protein
VGLLLLALVALPAQAQEWTPEPMAPSVSDAASAQAIEAYRQGDFPTAIAALEQALQNGKNQPGLHVMLASSLLQNGQPHQARSAATTGLARHPEHTALRLVKGEALMHTDDYEDALAVFDTLQDDLDRGHALLPDGIDAARFRTRMGLLHQWAGGQRLNAGHPEEALAHFETARTYMPDSVSAHQNVAYVLAQLERWGALDRETAASLDRFPEAESLLRLRVQALAHQERSPSEVRPLLGTLYKQNPDDPEVGLAYGRTLLAGQKIDAAEAVFDDLLTRHPDRRSLYDTLVEIHTQRFHVPAAIQVRRQEQAQFPRDRSVPRDIGRLYEQIGAFAEARAVYDSLRTLGGDGAHEDALAYARTYERQDSLAVAATAYQTLVTASPADPVLLRRLGSVQDRLARWNDALPTYRALADHAPTDAERAFALARQGRALEHLGRPDEAFSVYEDALALSPDMPLPYYRYAILVRRRDGVDPAYPHAEQALQKGLWAVADLQMDVTQRVRQESSNPWLASLDDDLQRRHIEDLNDQVAAIVDFYGTHFPQARTAPVIQDLQRRYPDSGRLLYLIGRYYATHDDPDAALSYYRDAVRHAPSLRSAHLALGAAYEEQGETRRALQSYERALALDDTAPDAYRALIRLYRVQNQLDALIARWQSRYRATPEHTVLRAHLLEALHKAGRYDEARTLAASQ